MWPDDDYLNSLGRFIYAVGYMEWTVLGHLPSLSEELPPELRLERLAGHTTGSIGRELADPSLLADVADPDLRDWLALAGEHLETVASKRNAVLHARPATIDGRQRLYRWDRTRREFFAITDEFLVDLLTDVEERTRDIEARRPT